MPALYAHSPDPHPPLPPTHPRWLRLQVVAGTNYKLFINVTCPSASGTNLTVGMEVEAFQGLDGTIDVRTWRAAGALP